MVIYGKCFRTLQGHISYSVHVILPITVTREFLYILIYRWKLKIIIYSREIFMNLVFTGWKANEQLTAGLRDVKHEYHVLKRT